MYNELRRDMDYKLNTDGTYTIKNRNGEDKKILYKTNADGSFNVNMICKKCKGLFPRQMGTDSIKEFKQRDRKDYICTGCEKPKNKGKKRYGLWYV